MSDDNLTEQTVAGLKWSWLGSVTTIVMQLIYTAVMSRLLSPREFGVFAIANLTVLFGQYFAQMGLGQALIQKDEIHEDDIRATWTSSIVLGTVVTIIGILAAPGIANVFGEPEAVGPLRVMSLSFLILGVQLTARSLLRRRMQFGVLALSQVAGFGIAFLGIGIGMAAAGAGVWSLVGANVAAHVVGGAIRFLAVRHTMRPIWAWAPYREMYAYGVRMSGIQILEFLSNNLDTAAVARFAESNLLGQYNRAFYMVNLPLNYLRDSLSQVLFPGFSRLQHDRERLREVYVGATTVSTAVIFPLCAGLAVAAQDIVTFVLGTQWGPAARVVPWLALAAAFSVISRFAAIAAEAVAELNLKLAIQVGYVGVLAGLMLVAADRALWVYGAALALGEVLRHLAFLLLMRRAIGLTIDDVLRTYLPGLASAGLVAGAIAGTRLALGGRAAGLLVVAEMTAGALALLAALRSPPLAGTRRELRHRLGRGGVLDSNRVARLVTLVLGEDPETQP